MINLRHRRELPSAECRDLLPITYLIFQTIGPYAFHNLHLKLPTFLRPLTSDAGHTICILFYTWWIYVIFLSWFQFISAWIHVHVWYTTNFLLRCLRIANTLDMCASGDIIYVLTHVSVRVKIKCGALRTRPTSAAFWPALAWYTNETLRIVFASNKWIAEN